VIFGLHYAMHRAAYRVRLKRSSETIVTISGFFGRTTDGRPSQVILKECR
jgi:hypothetical protein